MKISHLEIDEENKESITAFRLSLELSTVATTPNKMSNEALHALAIAVFENEGGLILTEDWI